MSDIYITRKMQEINTTLAKASIEIMRLRHENEKLQKLLEFALVKSGDINAEQSA